ncbi:MAG: hypothetical protein B7X10_02175, partial [Burkholderiales bacterium 21-58-4]
APSSNRIRLAGCASMNAGDDHAVPVDALNGRVARHIDTETIRFIDLKNQRARHSRQWMQIAAVLV